MPKETTMTEENYLDQLDDLEDDFDVEVKAYQPPPHFKEFIINPFPFGTRITILCKTGPIKLPKEIIERYTIELEWNFTNYHRIELMALLYLHYYKTSDEWQTNKGLLENEVQDILSSLPHFKSISELFTYAFTNGDLKYRDFEQVIESDATGSYEVTGFDDN